MPANSPAELRRPRLIVARAMAFVAALGGLRSAALADETPVEKALSEYRRALAEWDAHYSGYAASGRLTHRRSGRTRVDDLEILRAPGAVRTIQTCVAPEDPAAEKPYTVKNPRTNKDVTITPYRPPYGTAFCLDGDLGYELQKGEKSRPWAVRLLDEKPPRINSRVRYFTNELRCAFAESPTSASKIPLTSIASRPAYRLKSAGPWLGADGRPLTRLEFVLREPRPPAGARPKNVFAHHEGVTLLVAPEEHWAIHEYESISTLTAGGTEHVLGKVDYDGESSGFPNPKRVASRVVMKRPPAPDEVIDEETFEFTSLEFKTPPAAAFRFEAFGLPEFGKPAAPAAPKAAGP